jgi:hypothetical protein
MRGEWREVEREGLLFWHNLKMENGASGCNPNSKQSKPNKYLSQRKTHAI